MQRDLSRPAAPEPGRIKEGVPQQTAATVEAKSRECHTASHSISGGKSCHQQSSVGALVTCCAGAGEDEGGGATADGGYGGCGVPGVNDCRALREQPPQRR